MAPLVARIYLGRCLTATVRKEPKSFEQQIDELVEYSEYDPELAYGVRWLDEQAQKNGISFYEQAFVVWHNYNLGKKTKGWLGSKRDDARYRN